MSHRRSIVTFFVVFAFTGLFSLLGRGARLQQSTYNVTGKVVGGPPVLQSRPGGDLYLSLEGSEASRPSPRGGVIDQEGKRVMLRARVESDGSFAFSNVPLGSYHLQVYPLAAIQQSVVVIVVTDRDVIGVKVPLVTAEIVTSRHNLEPAWSLPGPWSGVAGAPSDGTIYAAVPGDRVMPPIFAIVASVAHIREIDFNGKVRREISTAGFRSARIALAQFPGLAGPVFLLFNDFADGVHAVDKDGNLLWVHPRNVGETDVTVMEGVGNNSDAVIISYFLGKTGIEVLEGYGKCLWESKGIERVAHVSAGDVLGQGKPQLVASANLGRVYIFNGAGALLTDLDPGTYAQMVRVCKLSQSDPVAMIFAMSARPADSAVTVTALTGAGKINWSAQLPSKIRPPSIYSASVAPGKPWLAVGLGDGQVFVVDEGHGTIIGSIDGQSLFPEVAWVTDHAGGNPRLVVSTHDALHAYTLGAK